MDRIKELKKFGKLLLYLVGIVSLIASFFLIKHGLEILRSLNG